MIKIRNIGFKYHVIDRMKITCKFLSERTETHHGNILHIAVYLAVGFGDHHFLKHDPYISFMIEGKILRQTSKMISLSVQGLAFIIGPFREDGKSIFNAILERVYHAYHRHIAIHFRFGTIGEQNNSARQGIESCEAGLYIELAFESEFVSIRCMCTRVEM